MNLRRIFWLTIGVWGAFGTLIWLASERSGQ
jgi:hypothetical protein